MPTLIHAEETEPIVCSEDGILHKFARFRVATGSMAAETDSTRLKKKGRKAEKHATV